MTYEQWDQIADVVVPTLGVVALLMPIIKTPLNRWMYYLSILVAYGATFGLNHPANPIWPLLGVEYSGHAGVFAIAGVSITVLRPKLAWIVGTIFVLYAWLMLFQRYHTVADIAVATTLMVPITLLIHVMTQRLASRMSNRHSPLGRRSSTEY